MCRPEAECDVVRDEKAGFGRCRGVDHGHEDDGADKGRNNVDSHNEAVLSGLLDEPSGAEQDADDECAEYHGKKLSLEKLCVH